MADCFIFSFHDWLIEKLNHLAISLLPGNYCIMSLNVGVPKHGQNVCLYTVQ